LGFVGAVVGHYVTGYDLTIMSVFGIVALSGVVVNDSLVLLDQININVRKALPVARAVLEAGQLRFRAVVLTTCTTIAGLAPLLLERSTQAQTLIPMAISLTFGLAFATALTLLVVPALYMGWHDLWRLGTWLIRGGEFPSVDAVPTLHQKRQL
jgi:multidrug efflux pump subunit AcrB